MLHRCEHCRVAHSARGSSSLYLSFPGWECGIGEMEGWGLWGQGGQWGCFWLFKAFSADCQGGTGGSATC